MGPNCGGNAANTSCEALPWLLWLHHLNVSRRPLSNQIPRVGDAASAAIFVSCRAVTRLGRQAPPLCVIDNSRRLNSVPIKTREIIQPDVPLMFIVPVRDAASFLKRSIINSLYTVSDLHGYIWSCQSPQKWNIPHVTSSRNDLKVISWSVINNKTISQYCSLQNKSIQKATPVKHTSTGRKCWKINSCLAEGTKPGAHYRPLRAFILKKNSFLRLPLIN